MVIVSGTPMVGVVRWVDEVAREVGPAPRWQRPPGSRGDGSRDQRRRAAMAVGVPMQGPANAATALPRRALFALALGRRCFPLTGRSAQCFHLAPTRLGHATSLSPTPARSSPGHFPTAPETPRFRTDHAHRNPVRQREPHLLLPSNNRWFPTVLNLVIRARQLNPRFCRPIQEVKPAWDNGLRENATFATDRRCSGSYLLVIRHDFAGAAESRRDSASMGARSTLPVTEERASVSGPIARPGRESMDRRQERTISHEGDEGARRRGALRRRTGARRHHACCRGQPTRRRARTRSRGEECADAD